MDIDIVWENRHLLVIDKPSGIVVNRAKTVSGETIQDWAEKRWKVESGKLKVKKGSEFYRRLGIVHRLDKETSGLLIIAKTEGAFIDLQTQFKKRKVKKEYRALVHGKVVSKRGKIKAPVSRLSWNRERFGVTVGGKSATTAFKVIYYLSYKGANYTYLMVFPKTGRTHQIRVHFKYLGFPVVSDKFYVGRKRLRGDKKICPRMFLHASGVKFQHPINKKEISVTSRLPRDLRAVISKMKRI